MHKVIVADGRDGTIFVNLDVPAQHSEKALEEALEMVKRGIKDNQPPKYTAEQIVKRAV